MQVRTLRPVSTERARAEPAGGMRACAVCRPDRVLNRSPSRENLEG
ncbi:DUF6233 domain-containing protein [Streptomyces parvus]